jgi:hypothetical protein
MHDVLRIAAAFVVPVFLQNAAPLNAQKAPIATRASSSAFRLAPIGPPN